MSKYCVNCKHVEEVVENPYAPQYGVFDKKYVCIRNITFYRDLVNGKLKVKDCKALDCVEQRAEISHVPNRCGVEGRYWEAK